MDFRCLRKAKRQLSKRGLTQDAAMQVQPCVSNNGRCSLKDEHQHSSAESGRQAEAEAPTTLPTELTVVIAENQQLQEDLAYAKEQLGLLQLQIDCNFSTAQMQQAAAACGVKRVTPKALSSGACKYMSDSSDDENSGSTFSKKEGAATPQNESHARTSTAATTAAELEDAAAKSMAAAKELAAQELAAHKPMSKTQKRKALFRQATKVREEALKQAKIQTDSQLLLVFAMSVMAILLIVVGIVYVGTQYVEGYEKSRLFLIGK